MHWAFVRSGSSDLTQPFYFIVYIIISLVILPFAICYFPFLLFSVIFLLPVLIPAFFPLPHLLPTLYSLSFVCLHSGRRSMAQFSESDVLHDFSDESPAHCTDPHQAALNGPDPCKVQSDSYEGTGVFWPF
jgi:hypothetical protein